MNTRVVAIDVGSVRNNFAWAGLDLPGRRPIGGGGRDPEGAASAVLEGLAAGRPVALGMEAPLMVPVSPTAPAGSWSSLGQARCGETIDGHSRPWSAGAGGAVLATGLVQLAWILERIVSAMPGLSCTTRPEAWGRGAAMLFVWEAFVSGDGKPVPDVISQHAADAAAAAETFADRLGLGTLASSDVVCTPASSFNLVAAAAAFAGLGIDRAELRSQVQVYRTRRARL